MPDGPRLPGVEDGEDEDRIVLHVDADCFYASCERLREPELRGEPVVVGMGYEPGETVGAVATASYEAREFGVESAQAIGTALERLPRREAVEDDSVTDSVDDPDGDIADPDAADGGDPDEAVADGSDEVVADGPNGDTAHGSDEEIAETGYYRPVDMDYYESVAAEVKAILHDCADVVREVSVDEAYLDVTDRTAWEVADGFARHVKSRIEQEVGVTVSVGVAPTMSAAKIASDFDKPDGLTVVRPDEVRSFLAPLGVDRLHGVGPVTARELHGLGLETVGDVAAADIDPLVERFGERGRELHEQARGEDDRRVAPRGAPKSFSRESAFAEAVSDPTPKREQVRTLAAAVADRARREGALYRTVGVKAVTPPYDVNTRERSLSGPVDDPDLVERIALDLIAEFEEDPVRKVGVRVANLEFVDADQPSLDTWDGTESVGRTGVIAGETDENGDGVGENDDGMGRNDDEMLENDDEMGRTDDSEPETASTGSHGDGQTTLGDF